MARRIVAIGLDAFSPILLENWLAAGELPNLARLFAAGTYARQRNFELYRTENSWLTLLQGCSPETSLEWGHQHYFPQEYRTEERALYAFQKIPPFYATGDLRVALFDLPLVGVTPGLPGIQLFGWGTEANQIQRESLPPDAMRAIIRRHGRHPLYDTLTMGEDGTERLSYRIPSVYDPARLETVQRQLVAAIRERTAIIRDLVVKHDWDLLMAAYGEVHTAGHLLWHSSQIHTLREPMRSAFPTDLFLETAREVDRCLGELVAVVPADAELLVFSPHGMRPNSLDVNSMLFLPELLYRWSTGQAAFRGWGDHGEPPPPRLDYSRHWREEVWDMRTDHGEAVLESPAEQEARGDPLDWDPGNWYRPAWPTMRAFSLPGYSEGLIRVNVSGRDGTGEGGVDPDAFAGVCTELVATLGDLRDLRSGEKLVQEVVRVRAGPHDEVHASPADLIVRWRDDLCGDVVDHPTLGRIGPAPFFRTGGHATKGFVLCVGETFAAGVRLPDVRTEDVTATMLDRLGCAIPPHVRGVPIDNVAIAVAGVGAVSG